MKKGSHFVSLANHIQRKNESSFAEAKVSLKRREDEIADLFHELKSLNANLPEAVRTFDEALENDNTNLQLQSSLDIKGLASLISMRMSLYEYLSQPECVIGILPDRISVYRGIEHIYKCLNAGKKDSKRWRTVNMTGESHGRFQAPSVLRVALFIVLENAFKHGVLPNHSIDINFKETQDQLFVTVTNYGLAVADEEMERLMERGYRGKLVVKQGKVKGKGLGLNIAKDIFEATGVSIKLFSHKDKIEKVGNYDYAPFEVQLVFSPIVFLKR